MTDEKTLATIAPCGLCCETCFAHVDGEIRKLSQKLKEKLGNFHLNAKRFETLLGDPVFALYPDFKRMLDYFAAENCQGCRKEQCKLFKNCGVRKCHQEKGLEFCFQCGEFPCDHTNFDPGLQQRWEKINLTIRAIGIEEYSQKARNRPRYG